MASGLFMFRLLTCLVALGLVVKCAMDRNADGVVGWLVAFLFFVQHTFDEHSGASANG